MKAIVYHGPGNKSWEEKQPPQLQLSTAINIKLEKLWSKNVTMTTRLVDTQTTPLLLKTGGC